MARRSDPQETIAAALSALFLVGFVVLFGWLLLETWSGRGQLPRFTQSEMFTHITTSIVGLVGGISAARMNQRARTERGMRTTLAWIFVASYFVLGLAALLTLLVNSAGGRPDAVPEAVKNLGTVSFGLAVAAIGSYMGANM